MKGVAPTGRKLAFASVMLMFCTGGCGLKQWAQNGFKVGPNYAAPPAPIADQWIDYQPSGSGATTRPASLNQWWHVFDDPVLDSLVSDAYAQNLNLREAGERITEARAVRGIAVGNLFPQTQEMAGSYTTNKFSDRTVNRSPDQWLNNAEVGFNLAWEIDFWGRFRRSIESADAALEASIANYDDVLVLLLSDVASTYIQYRTFQERLELARENVRIQEQAYQLASDTFRFGRATERDVQQSKQILEQTRSTIPDLEAGLRRTNNALCVLLGIPTQQLSGRLGEIGHIPLGSPDLQVGIPADLLRRRPDVRRAEREAASQSASIGVAQSDLYPRFSLLGSLGLAGEEISDLAHTPGTWAWSFGPQFQWPILNYGRIENNVAIQEARFRQAVLRFQNAVLRANREAEDAMINYVKAQERMKHLTDSVVAAQRTVDITYDQYRQGVVDFTPVFIFEAALTSQQDALAQAQADIALSLIDLYRSLGGGWEAESAENYNAPPVPAPTTQRAPSRRPATVPS